MMKKKYRMPVFSIYGFVRFADEIVDSLYAFDRRKLFEKFKADTWEAIQEGISSNPILQSFQLVVNEYQIDHTLIEAFLSSMEMDLSEYQFDRQKFGRYIYGSAEVVGLMCLRVFYQNNGEEYERLKSYARKLGEAFQKVNFLRDIRSDYLQKGRLYFPGIDFQNLLPETKKQIEEEIRQDFAAAYEGVRLLKKDVRLGVWLAYNYYLRLLRKIEKTTAGELLRKRYRISNLAKVIILVQTFLRNKFNMV
jgi:phytoene/squalene synthetase